MRKWKMGRKNWHEQIKDKEKTYRKTKDLKKELTCEPPWPSYTPKK